jgi:RND family efflux transporter MFP subunit
MSRSTPPFRWSRYALALLVAAGVAAGGWYAFGRDQPLFGGGAAPAREPRPPAAVTVDVVAPKPGGIDRVCTQPGTVEPIASADLYAKVSGYLAEQAVDIGSRVKQGDVLARLHVPEVEKQVERDAADVRRADARLGQASAAVATAEAETRAATAAVALAQDDQKSKASYRAYRAKQRDRLRTLLAQQAIDAKLVDEQEDQYEAAVAAESAAGGAVVAAKEKEAAAGAKVEQAKADRKLAEAEVAVAKAQHERSAVMLGYAAITSPYTGVVTRRNFHPGDFVRSADAGGDRMPVLTVERTDVMRLVVHVPDRDVPYVSAGDPAAVAIDALTGSGVVFQAPGGGPPVVSRSAESEDTHSRTMRTEVDLGNPGGQVRRGMYGRVTLKLHAGAPSAVRVPSAALVGKAEAGKATVRVVRDGKVYTVPVATGSDNGLEVEVLSGLTPADRVVVRLSGAAADGAPVTVTEAK